ncbi:T-complex protein 1 subunit epsilon-like [Lactuca sativa]|uniref:T-complex protein 1 subunit epsilon-like n=1 Tax=Lactuca sativa TaxID=4236 RepID=UPI0022B04548|nr:T-complex protein 1 subunit epsilon-like [Lactuca sativa]
MSPLKGHHCWLVVDALFVAADAPFVAAKVASPLMLSVATKGVAAINIGVKEQENVGDAVGGGEWFGEVTSASERRMIDQKNTQADSQAFFFNIDKKHGYESNLIKDHDRFWGLWEARRNRLCEPDAKSSPLGLSYGDTCFVLGICSSTVETCCRLLLEEVDDALYYYNKCLESEEIICLDRRMTIEVVDGLHKAQIYEHDVGSLDKSKQTSDDGKDNTWLCVFQAAQDADLAVTSNISPEGVEKTGAPTDTASPFSMQVVVGGGGGVSPFMSMADNAAAVAASLRMVTVVRKKQGGNSVPTVLLCGSTDSILDDLVRAVDDGVNTYKDTRIVPGAAATEIELARKLKEFSFSETGLDQYVIGKFTESFEMIPKTLAENVKVGIDLEEGACKDVSTLKEIISLFLVLCLQGR